MRKLPFDRQGIVELSSEELKQVEGGGLISDWVASAVSYIKCSCGQSISYSDSALFGPNTSHYM